MDERNGFILKFTPKGRCIFSSFLGGEDTDVGVGVTWHSNSSYIVTGFTQSENFPVYHAIQGEYGGAPYYDMCVMRVTTINLESAGMELWVTGVITTGILAAFIGASVTIVLIQRKRGN